MAPGYPTKKRDDQLRERIEILEKKVIEVLEKKVEDLEKLILIMGEKECLQKNN